MREIIYKGQALPIHFGIKAINSYVKLQGKEFEETVTTTNSLANLDSIVLLAQSGLNEGARKSGSQTRYTEDDVWDMFDEDPTLILKVSEIFIESVVPLTDKLGSLNPTDAKLRAKSSSLGLCRGAKEEGERSNPNAAPTATQSPNQ
ncbi:MAG: hypothetical protein SNG81_04285 [Rikenellaceae bacterium]